MIRYHDVRQLTTAELERTKRDLRTNLGLITPNSPAHVPIQGVRLSEGCVISGCSGHAAKPSCSVVAGS
jgi:hypothetical protein